MNSQRHISIRDYIRVIRRRWKLVAIFATLGLLLGILKYFTTQYAFGASSQVLIERPSGYAIVTGISGLGTATSTKQQLQFLETDSYVRLGRSMTDLAFRIPLDLTEQATMDDISNFIQTDVLNSAYVTPVRLVLYDRPSPSLLSFEQERTIADAPTMSENLRGLARMALGSDFSLDAGWERGRPGTSDQAVWKNLQRLANSPLLESWENWGITKSVAAQRVPLSEVTNENRVNGARLRMAADAFGTLNLVDRHYKLNKKRNKAFSELTDPAEVAGTAQEIMSSKEVQTLLKEPQPFNWADMQPSQRLALLERTREEMRVLLRKAPEKVETAWSVSGREVADGAEIIAINATGPSPVQARVFANAMAGMTVWKDRMTKVADAERSARFLAKALGNSDSGATKLLHDAEDNLTAFRKANKTLDLGEELKIAVGRAAELDSQRISADAGIKEAGATLAKLQQQMGTRDQFWIQRQVANSPLMNDLKQQLYRAEAELAGMQNPSGYTDNYPPVQSLKSQIASLKKRINQEAVKSVSESIAPDPVRSALAQQAAGLAASQVGLEARRQAVQSVLKKVESSFTNLPGKQADMVRLMRAQALAERQYTGIYERLLDARNNKEMRQGNARVVQLSMDPGKKVAPRLRNIIMLALLGTFFGALCAIALSTTDTHLRNADDVQRELNLPVLAHLPEIPAGHTLVVETLPKAAVTEGFRSLRSTLRFIAADKAIKTLAATSARAAEGKSTVVANLAASMAQAGMNVTAVDADMRRPRLSSLFGAATMTGLSDVLDDRCTAVSARIPTRIPHLYLVPSGASPANPGELLENGRIEKVLTELREGADLVLVDTPPIGVVADAALAGSAADATVLVMESGTVEPAEARATIEKLVTNARANVIGVVLVGGDAPVSEDYVRYVSLDSSRGDGGLSERSGGSRRPRSTKA